MSDSVMKQVVQLVNQLVHANKAYANLWVTHVLWTWQWWFQLIAALVANAVWLILRKKNSTGRLLFVGFVVLFIAMWMDFMGNSFGLWYYPYELIPSLPPFFPWESIIPIEVLLLLQYKPTYSPWAKAIAFGLANSFVFEPITKLLGLYVLEHWRYIYSFPIYVFIYMIAHYVAKIATFNRLTQM